METPNGAGPAPEAEGLASWLRIARRRWAAGAGVFVAVLLLAIAVLFGTRPVYRAEAALRLGEPPPALGLTPSIGLLGFRFGGDPFANELALLGSRALVESVVQDAALHVRVDLPRGWHRDSVFLELSASRETSKAAYEVEWLDDGRVSVRRTAPAEAPAVIVRAGAAVEIGAVRAAFRPWREGLPRRVDLRTLPFAEAVRQNRKRIRAERTAREANVVALRYDDPDPGIARRTVAAAAAHYIELRTDLQRRESGQTVDSLRAAAKRTAAELETAEGELEALQRRVRLFAPEVQGEAFVEQYSAASALLERDRSALAVVDGVLQRIDSVEVPSEAWAELVAFPEFLENSTVGELLTGLTALEQQRAELATRRSPESAELRLVAEQMAYMDGVLRSLARSYRTALRERVTRLERQVASMNATLAQMPSDVIELARRQRAVKLLTEVLALTEVRLRQEELRQALTFSNVQVIDPPALLYRPVWPRKKLGLAVGLLFASVFGLLGMAAAERADGTVRRARRVRELLRAPVLGVAWRDAGGRLRLEAADASVALRPLVRDGALVLAPASAAVPAAELGEALAANGAESPAHDRPRFRVVPPVASFGAALEAGRDQVVLIVEPGRTREAELRRSAELLREAGAEIVGAILLCDARRGADGVWD